MAGVHVIARAAGVKDTVALSLFSAILDQMAEGNRVYIKDFGSFVPVKRKARVVLSPQIKGGRAEVPERMVIKFRPSPVTKKVLNGDDKPKAKKPKKDKKSDG